MKYFIDQNNAVFAFSDDGSQDYLILETMRPVSEEEALSIALPPPTAGELLSAAKLNQATLLSGAAFAIAPLQDAVDIDDATPAEIALLKNWKKYRVSINRIDLTSQNIVWPMSPAG